MNGEPFDPARHVGESVTVRGRAWDGAAGAHIDAGGRMLYIDGLDRWPAGVQGSDVEVTGTLRVRGQQVPAPGESDEALHGLDAATFVLDDAAWQPAGG